MNSRILNVVLMVCAVVSLSFKSQGQSRPTKGKVLQTQSRTNADEANDRARRYFSQLFTQCGDSVFTNEWSDILRSSHVLQFKNGGITFDSTQPVSNAERLNGIEWKGQFRLFATAQRVRNSNGTWDPWEDFNGKLTRWHFTVIKKTTGWQVDPNPYSSWKNFSKIECSVSPSGEVLIRDPNDLSDTYGYLKPYIFNKKTLVIFTTPEQFFSDSGRNSFVGLKYDVVKRLPSDLRYVGGRRLTPAEYAQMERGQ